MKYLTLKINSYNFLSLLFNTMFQFCLSKNIFVPRFCYHNLLNIAGNCRICLLETKQSLKLVVSCATSIINSLDIFTKTKAVKKARESVLEQLLINHPLDCPICDQGGECDLQDQTMVFGGDKTRFYELKKKSIENKIFGSTIKMFLNRCIYCGRCTRFLNDLNSNFKLKMLGRGDKMEISLYEKKFYSNDFLTSNVVDLCPVGALLSKPYSFLARPWEIISNKSISILDSLCSNIQIDYQGTLILRILPRTNNFLNEEWICDKTRFFFDSIIYQRLVKPYINNNNLLFDINWLKYLKFIFYFYFNLYKINLLKKKKNILINFNIGYFLSFDLILLVKIYLQSIGSLNLYFFKKTQKFNNDFRSTYLPSLVSYYWKSIDFASVISSNLRFENPILNLKFKFISKLKNFIFYLFGFLSNLNLNFFFFGNNNKFYFKIFEFYYISLKKIINPIIFFGTLKYNLVFNLINYFNIYYLNLYLPFLSFSELNLDRLNSNSNSNLNYFIGIDDFIINSNFTNKFSIYQGQHGDYSSCKTLFILPTKSFIEKSFFYLNLEGWMQNNGFLIYRYDFEKIKNDFEILFNLGEIFISKFNRFYDYTIFINYYLKNYFNFLEVIKFFFLKYDFINYNFLKRIYKKNSFSFNNNLTFSSYYRNSKVIKQFFFFKNDFRFLQKIFYYV